MPMITDPRTGFEMGDPVRIPLNDARIPLPSKSDMEAALASMILSASGWRTVFAASGSEEDCSPDVGDAHLALAALMADAYAQYIRARKGENCRVIVGIDSRPTGTLLADTMIRVLLGHKIQIEYLFITAAPEIMAYSRRADGFVYISASHNPIGHNGVKFGADDGGVIPAPEAAALIADFRKRCEKTDAAAYAASLIKAADTADVESVYRSVSRHKAAAVAAYADFTKEVVSGSGDSVSQTRFFSQLRETVKENPLTVVCDMNGSARTLSIDSSFIQDCGISFRTINNVPRSIVHGIIPELENLSYCAEALAQFHRQGENAAIGYMPDCDGDRGNIVFWNEQTGSAEILKAQEVFALSVMSELAYSSWQHGCDGTPQSIRNLKRAVAVNDATSMRIEQIASVFGAVVARAEVGEANVVNRAREMRAAGYEVRILGEGSNGGNITWPASVRDPVNTLFALIKLLTLRDTEQTDGSVRPGLFHIWCLLSGQENKYKENFTLADIIEALPPYTTTGSSEKRALLHIKTQDQCILKQQFQRIFEKQWNEKKDVLLQEYGIAGYEAFAYNGTAEKGMITDFGVSARGGLKIIFKNDSGEAIAFIWMRGSGTEPVFRIMCDVKGINPNMEAALLQWETEMLAEADK